MSIVINSCPSGLCLSGNLPKLTLTSESEVRVRILDAILRTIMDETYTPDSDHKISLDLTEIVRDSLGVTMPNGNNIFIQENLARHFTLYLDDNSYYFTAVLCGVKELTGTTEAFFRTNFLTWQPQLKKVTATQPEWLTYCAVQQCYIHVAATFEDNTTSTKTLTTFSDGRPYTVNMSAAYIGSQFGRMPVTYMAYITGNASPTASPISNIQLYEIVESTPHEQVFCFKNSLGGIDTVRCTGEVKTTPEYTPSIALMNARERAYFIEKKDTRTQNTGWLLKAEAEWLHELFMSLNSYHYAGGRLNPIVIDEATAETSTMEDLTAFEFSWRPAEASPYLNVKRDAVTATCSWGDFINILTLGDIAITSTWDDFMNVIREGYGSGFSYGFSKGFNVNSPDPPYFEINPDSLWLEPEGGEEQANIESNTNWELGG